MFFLDSENFKNARLTLTLIFINLFCYVGFNILFSWEIFALYVQINSKVFQDFEIWRLFTSMFLHADLMHLFSNMVALLLFGTVIETTLSKIEYLIIYIISGLVGNLFSLLLLDPYTYSLGASGAIFGLIGASFMIIAREEDKTMIYLGLMYIAYFLLSSLSPGINLWAHLFGLITGLLFGYLLTSKRKKINDY